MGDIIMTGPAMRALKETFHCTITLLTSRMGALITPCLSCIDETIICNPPWVKLGDRLPPENCLDLVQEIKKHHFDAAVIFTAYSQSALPAALLCYQAGIPRRLAYCRENPYTLLTDWVPDKEPYSKILHQVQRDLFLVRAVGADIAGDRLRLNVSFEALETLAAKLAVAGIDPDQPFIIVHTGVSEKKREYPLADWIDIVRGLRRQFEMPVLLTGSQQDKAQAEFIQQEAGHGVFSMAGKLTVEEFAALVREATLVISVNTATVHVAAATGTPVIVLYAQTNPQHTPWKVPSRVIYFPVKEELRSKNEVINFVSNQLYAAPLSMPRSPDVLKAAARILKGKWLKREPGNTIQ
jgi:ADP-heptose:LPS heptosyltransferase